MVDPREQDSDPFRQRYQQLKAASKEFLLDDDGSSSLVFQKASDSEYVPDFIQYVYCWLIGNRLGGLVFSGVSTDVGNHEHISQQESAFWDQAAEIALGSRASTIRTRTGS